jgi:hypothetical protein
VPIYLFLFSPFPVGRGTEINELCIQSRNNLIVCSTISFLEKETNAAPHRIGAITEHHSHNPSSPRVPGYGQGYLTISWRLVFYEVYTKIERNAVLWENMGGFSLSNSHFLRREDHVIDFLGENA